jgi:chemotaxis protein MotB
MGKKPDAPEPPTSPGWMTTYGDLMSLLLVFFILLVSFSTMEIVKFRQAIGSMRGGSGVLDPSSGSSMIEEPQSPENADFEEALTELIEELEEQEIADAVNVYWDSKGVRFIMQDKVLFNPGSAKIKTTFLKTIDAVISVMGTLSIEEIQIDGHTDNFPIATAKYPSNWELSVARAVAMLRYVEIANIVPKRKLVAKGFGEYRPTVPNDSVENRSKNRRVEIYVLKRQ